MKSLIILATIILLAVTSCSNDPVKLAKSEKIKAETEIQLEKWEMEKERLNQDQIQQQSINSATLGERIETKLKWYEFSAYLASFAKVASGILLIGCSIAIVILSIGYSVGFSLNRVNTANFITVQANSKTMLYPEIVHVSKGVARVYDPESGALLDFNVRNPADVNRIRALMLSRMAQSAASRGVPPKINWEGLLQPREDEQGIMSIVPESIQTDSA